MTPDSIQPIAKSYEKSAAVAEESGQRLLERLDELRFDPKTIIEVGCATGRQLAALHQRYPAAGLFGIDLSTAMLKQARRKRGWWRPRFRLLRAQANALPFADACADLVYINLTPSWLADSRSALADARRVLRPGGLLLVSALGPDTLRELIERELIEREALLIQWMADVQGLGGELVRAGFSEPVLDTDWLTTTHSSRDALRAELRGAGLLSPMGRATGSATQDAEPISAHWEIVSASAWAPESGHPVRGVQGEEVSIPISQIGRRQRA